MVPAHENAPPRAREVVLAYLASVAVVALCTLVSWLMFPRFDPRNLAMVYLLGVAFVATRFGRGPSVLASFLGVVTFEFCFMPPYFEFTNDPQTVFTFAVTLVVALLISTLASRVREQAEEARRRARRTQILYALTRDLAGLSDPGEIANAAARRLSEVFGTPAEILPAAATPDPSSSIALPLQGSASVVGIAALERPPGSGGRLPPESQTLLEALAGQIAVSIERAHLAAETERTRIDVERERLRNALLSSVSHDLRTPLSVIKGAATSLLQGEGLSEGSRQDLCATISEESERLNRLVGNLLDMTRVQSGDLRVAKEWHSIEEVVGSALRRLKNPLREHRVGLDFPRDLPLVPLDAVLIEQVFVNLLENAGKYTPPGSAIQITARQEAGTLAVAVADAGPGLPPGAPNDLFETFGGDRQHRGLGLAICRAIVTAHGGRIAASTRTEGGALFRFALPLEGAGLPPSPETGG